MSSDAARCGSQRRPQQDARDDMAQNKRQRIGSGNYYYRPLSTKTILMNNRYRRNDDIEIGVVSPSSTPPDSLLSVAIQREPEIVVVSSPSTPPDRLLSVATQRDSGIIATSQQQSDDAYLAPQLNDQRQRDGEASDVPSDKAQPAAGLNNGQRSQRRAGLGSLTLQNKLGSGTYGTVFKCTWQTRRLAVKTYRRAGRCAAERELEVLMHLHATPKSPLICHLLAYRKTRLGKYFLFFELMRCDLRMCIQRSSDRGVVIDVHQAILWTQNLSAAVAFLHSRRIIHRDLKPANILLRKMDDGRLPAAMAEQCQPLPTPDQCRQPAATTEQWQAAIADFGNSAIVQSNRRASHGGGACALETWAVTGRSLSRKVCTLWYAAPEMLVSDAPYGYPVDIWSLGLVLFEIEAREAACPTRARAPDWEQLQAFWHLCQPAAAQGSSFGLVGRVRQVLARNNVFPWLGTHGLIMANGRVKRRSDVGELYGPRFRTFAFRLLHFEPQWRVSARELSASCDLAFQRHAIDPASCWWMMSL